MDLLKQFNLPSYLKNKKTFADMSKCIADKFEGRTDPESIQTMNELQGRLRDAQEFVKSSQQQTQQGQPMQQPSPQESEYKYGGYKKNSYEDGGFMDFFSKMGGSGASGGAAGAAGPMAAVGGAINLASMIADNKVDTSGATMPQEVDRVGNTLKGAKSGMDIGGAIAPGIGHAIGAIGGGLIGGFSGPSKKKLKEAEANHTYAQVNQGSNIGKYGMDLNDSEPPEDYVYDDFEEQEIMNAEDSRVSKMPTSLYDGLSTRNLTSGLMSKAKSITGINDFDPHNSNHVTSLQRSMLNDPKNNNRNDLYFSGEEGSYINEDGSKSQNKAGIDGKFGIDTFHALQQRGMSNFKSREGFKVNQDILTDGMDLTPRAKGYYNEINKNENENENENSNKDFDAEFLRYAPAAMNLAQLASLKKPEEVAFGRSNRKYKQQLVDEKGMQNIVNQATASTRDAILSSSGGSSSRSRANLLASQLQGTKALSNAYQQSGLENRQEGRKAQQFDANTERFNIGQDDKSQLTNLQLKAGYETNKSRLLAQLGQDLGGVGTEEMMKKYPELMGLSYDSKGMHIPTKKRKKKKNKN